MSNFTIDMLAAELKVSRRTIERCIVAGALVPSPDVLDVPKGSARQAHYNLRYTFAAEHVAELKARADTARRLRFKNIMKAILADGPVVPPARYTPAPRLSPQAFIEQKLWKWQNTWRHRPAAKDMGKVATDSIKQK